MLTNPQKALLKRAQRAAGLPDDEYREAIATVTGMEDCRSSTDPRLTDAHLDRLMAYLEAIQNRRGATRGGGSATYWQTKNPKGCTSRDRHGSAALEGAIRRLEAAMQARGKGAAYLASIQAKTGRTWAYVGALNRTLKTLGGSAPAQPAGPAAHQAPPAAGVATPPADGRRVYTVYR